MIDIKKLSGVLNLDDREENILQTQHIQALNGRFYGGAQGMTFENIPGNQEIINNLLPSGQNEMIGGLFDQIGMRLIWHNWNSNQDHGIYMYSLGSGVVNRILQNSINAQSDILNFDLDFPFADPYIIYTTPEDGDIYFFNSRNNRPKRINLKEALDNVYGSNWLETYLDVAIDVPLIPPVVVYEDDPSSTVNSLRKKLFKAQQRQWNADNEKCTYGPQSEIPVPSNYSDPQVDTDPTRNCRISISIQTGNAAVKKLEIVMYESLGNVFSKPFSVVILDKAVMGIPDNDIYIYKFYNNQAYDFVDNDEAILDFSRVPFRANAQSAVNGNVPAYAGITEGKNPIIPNVSWNVQGQRILAVNTSGTFSVTQYGLEGFQIGKDIKFLILGTVRMGDIYTAKIGVGATVFNITYTVQVGDTFAQVVTGLSTSATSQGFSTSFTIGSNILIVIRPNQQLLNFFLTGYDQTINATFNINNPLNTVTIVGGAAYLYLFNKGVQFILFPGTNTGILTVVSAVVSAGNVVITVKSTKTTESFSGQLYFVSPLNDSTPTYNASSQENWALIYFDEKDVSCGALTSASFNVTTNFLNVGFTSDAPLFNLPFVNLSIFNRPPLDAVSYQILRSGNLSKNSWLYWITDRTFKDDKFAYISVESINAYKRINKNSIISYDFLPGDRIKFYILFSTEGIGIGVYQNEHDYEIIDQIIDPDINGVTRTGQFLKITLPNIDSLFNFSTGITLDYSYYYIELYTPAKSAAEGLNVYYECNQEYAIGNPGTSQAFHQGMLQNQSPNLATPATFKFDKGDAWYRTRVISIGNTILYDVISGFFSISAGSVNPFSEVLGQHLTVQAYVTNDYQVAQDVSFAPYVPNYNFPNWTISVVGLNTYDFRVRGVVNISVVNIIGGASSLNMALFIDVTTQANIVTSYNLATVNGIVNGTDSIYDFDSIISILPNSKTFFYIKILNPVPSTSVQANLISGFISYTEPKKDFEIGVIDQNFSDFFPSKVNSNGRSWKINPDEKTNTFGTLVRTGGPYQQNTNLNQTNIFYPDSFVEAYRSEGDIQRIVQRGTQLLIFQERRIGFFGIYGQYIKTSDNDSQLTTTDSILTKTNIQYYEAETGIGKQYTCLVINKRAIYFVDPVRGYQGRLSGDGVIFISELYLGQYTIKQLLIPYNGSVTRPDLSHSKILGFYDTFEEDFVCILQGGETTRGNILPPYMFSFNEPRNAYGSFYDDHPEWAICGEDLIYTWLNGRLWIRNSETYCNFYGQQYSASITLVFNTQLIEKKTPESIAELASAIWACPLIFTNVKSYGNQRQESELIDQDFAALEGMFEASFLRDANSINGLLNGDFLKSNYIVIKFEIQNASNLVYLTEVKLMYKDSPLTSK